MTYKFVQGESVPWFTAPTLEGNSNFAFDTAAGRYVLLLFLGSAASGEAAAALQLLGAYRPLFDDMRASFFGISSDPTDAATGRIAKQMPGIRWFLDYDRKLSLTYGAVDEQGGGRPHWLLLDSKLSVVSMAALADGVGILDQLGSLLAQPPREEFAPVLVVPGIFEPTLCRHLMDLYDTHGGEASGFMREVNGVTTGLYDHNFKRRSDYGIEEGPLRQVIRERLVSALVPQIRRSFQFAVTRLERYIVACYDGDGGGGYFRAHRDNTTPGTAHRRFACSINLNAEDYEGGDLRFPEYGSKLYRPPTGGAVVFSCSLLHEAMPVTRGKRYAYLPFFYDEAAAKQREAIAKAGQVGSELASYRA